MLLDRMRDIGLRTDMFARAMIDVVTGLHYRVRIVAYDVELVPDSTPLDSAVHAESTTATTPAKLHRCITTMVEKSGKESTNITFLWTTVQSLQQNLDNFQGLEIAVNKPSLKALRTSRQ